MTFYPPGPVHCNIGARYAQLGPYRRVWRSKCKATESIGLGPSPCQPIVDMCRVCVVEEEDPWKKSSAGAGRSIIGYRPKALARVRWKAPVASARFPVSRTAHALATVPNCVRRHEISADDRPSLSAHMASLMPQACARCWRRKQRVCDAPNTRPMRRDN
jgi:hypothetical protein